MIVLFVLITFPQMRTDLKQVTIELRKIKYLCDQIIIFRFLRCLILRSVKLEHLNTDENFTDAPM